MNLKLEKSHSRHSSLWKWKYENMGRTYLGYGCNVWAKTEMIGQTPDRKQLGGKRTNEMILSHTTNLATIQVPGMISTQAPARVVWTSSNSHSAASSLFCVWKQTQSPAHGHGVSGSGNLNVFARQETNPRCYLRTWTLSQQKPRHLQIGHKSENVFRRKVGPIQETGVFLSTVANAKKLFEHLFSPFYLLKGASPPPHFLHEKNIQQCQVSS